MNKQNEPMFSGKSIAKIIIPLVLQNILVITIGLVDSIMVSSRGESAYAGVSLVTSLDTLLITLFSSITSGGAVVLAQSMGRGDRKNTCDAAKQLLYVATAVAVFISAFVLILRTPILHILFGKAEASVINNAMAYFSIIAISFPFLAIEYGVSAIFRAQGDSMISLKISLFMNMINIGGNAILIYGANLGARGAALATLLSRVIGATLMLIIVHNAKRFIYIEKLFHYRPDKATIKSILSFGIPNGIEDALFQFGRLMTSSLVSSLGTVAIAANAAALSLANFQYNAGNAVKSTLLTVVGRCIGAKQLGQAKRYAKQLIVIGHGIVISVAILLCLFSTPLLRLFNLSAEATQTARGLLFYHGAASVLLWTIAFCLPSAFRAASDIRFTMVISVVSMWVFRVALAYVLAKDTVSLFGLFQFSGANFGVMGVWVAMTVDWVVRAAIFLWRFLSGKWLSKQQTAKQ